MGIARVKGSMLFKHQGTGLIVVGQSRGRGQGKEGVGVIAGRRLSLRMSPAGGGSLFRTLQEIHGRLTSRRTVPTCVMLSSGMLRLLDVSHPVAVRTFKGVDNVNRFGGGGCNGRFMRMVHRFR